MHDAEGQWWGMIDDILTGPAADWAMLDSVCTIHEYGQEATAEEVRYRIDLKRWAVAYSPMHPAANPRRPVNSDQLLPF